MAPRKGTKKIDGKIYGLKTDYYSKRLATKEANRIRRAGWLVRIIKRAARGTEKRYSKVVYELWIRKGRSKNPPDWRKKRKK